MDLLVEKLDLFKLTDNLAVAKDGCDMYFLEGKNGWVKTSAIKILTENKFQLDLLRRSIQKVFGSRFDLYYLGFDETTSQKRLFIFSILYYPDDKSCIPYMTGPYIERFHHVDAIQLACSFMKNHKQIIEHCNISNELTAS